MGGDAFVPTGIVATEGKAEGCSIVIVGTWEIGEWVLFVWSPWGTSTGVKGNRPHSKQENDNWESLGGQERERLDGVDPFRLALE